MARNGNIIAEEVMKTSIPSQLHLLYGIANAMDILRIAIDDQLRDIYYRFGKDTKNKIHGFGEQDRRSLKNYIHSAKAMEMGFEKDMERMIQAATLGDDGKVDIDNYDSFMNDSNWCIKLLMYAVDRNVTRQDILDMVKAIPKAEKSIFPDELIERLFTLK